VTARLWQLEPTIVLQWGRIMDVHALGSNEELPELDHVIVVKLANARFEVSGTAGCERTDAVYLRPVVFSHQADALKHAEEFADAHSLRSIYIKGFGAAIPAS
jgi:hypothetical protein